MARSLVTLPIGTWYMLYDGVQLANRKVHKDSKNMRGRGDGNN